MHLKIYLPLPCKIKFIIKYSFSSPEYFVHDCLFMPILLTDRWPPVQEHILKPWLKYKYGFVIYFYTTSISLEKAVKILAQWAGFTNELKQRRVIITCGIVSYKNTSKDLLQYLHFYWGNLTTHDILISTF